MVYLEERAYLRREKHGHVEYQEELARGTLPAEKNWEREKEDSFQLRQKCEVDVQCRKRNG